MNKEGRLILGLYNLAFSYLVHICIANSWTTCMPNYGTPDRKTHKDSEKGSVSCGARLQQMPASCRVAAAHSKLTCPARNASVVWIKRCTTVNDTRGWVSLMLSLQQDRSGKYQALKLIAKCEEMACSRRACGSCTLNCCMT